MNSKVKTVDFIEQFVEILDEEVLNQIKLRIINEMYKDLQKTFDPMNGCPLCRCSYDTIYETNKGDNTI